MSVFLFIVAYISLNIISSVLYVGLLLLFFRAMKRIFNMNEDKWSALFKYRKGKGLYFIMIFPILLMIATMYPVSISLFKLINFEHAVLGYLAVILLPTFILIFNLPKLKNSIGKNYEESH